MIKIKKVKFLFIAIFSIFQTYSQTCSIQATNNTICAGNSTVLSLSTDMTGSLTYTWNNVISSNSSITISPTTNTQVTCTVSNGTQTCDAIPVTIYVNSIPSITSTTPNSHCGSGTVNLSANASEGNVNWYANSTGGISLGTGTSFTTPTLNATTTYYVDASNNGCTSSPRIAVSATINQVPSISNKTASICSGTSFTISPVNGVDLVPAGTTYNWQAPSVIGISGTTNGSNASNISGLLNNSSGSSLVVTYNVTPISQLGSCTGSPFNVDVTVNAELTPSISNQIQSMCSAGTFLNTPVDGSGNIVPIGTTYSWAAPSVSGITGTAPGTAASSISGTLTNVTNSAVNVPYTITPTSGSCIGSPFTFTVTVNPKPNILPQTSTICSDGAFTVTPTNVSVNLVPSGTTYSWSAPSVSGITGTAAGTSASSISGTLTNATNAAITVIYTISPLSGTCSGQPFTTTVTISPKPSVTPQTSTICSAGLFNISPTNGSGNIVPTGTTYSWAAPSVLGITGTAPGTAASSISGALTNATNSAVNVPYTITPTSGSCLGSPFTFTLTVNPKPSIFPQTTIVCSNVNFAVSPANGSGNIVPTGTTYSWAAPSVSGITGTAAGTATSSISGTLTNTTNTVLNALYNVTPTAGSCVGTSFTVTVTMKPKPNIASNNQSVCSSINYIGNWSTPDIVPSNTLYTWVVTNNTQVIGETNNNTALTFIQTITNLTLQNQTVVYSVTPSADGCFGSPFTLNLEVKPSPVANAGSNFTKTCLENINGNSIGSSSVPGFSYSWSPSLGLSSASIANPIANPSSNSIYTLTVTDQLSSCSATDQVLVTVNNTPPTANAGADGTITCVSNPNGITIGAVPSSGYSYAWSPISGLASSNSSSTIANPNTSQSYTLTVTNNSNGCTSTDQVLVSVNNINPTANAGSDITISCIANTTGAQIGTPAISGNTYTWSPTLGLSSANSANPIANPNNTTTYTLMVTNSLNGCTSSDQVTVEVNQQQPSVNAGSDFTKTCIANSFGASIGMSAQPNTSYSWSPTVALSSSTLSNPIANPNVTTTYSLTATSLVNGCTASDQIIVTVNQINPSINAGNDFTKTCISNIDGNSIGMNAVSGITYSWLPSTGLSSSSNSNPIANPSQTTLYTLTATDVNNGCTSSDNVTVFVDNTSPSVSAGTNQSICEGTVANLAGTSNVSNIEWSPSFLVADPDVLTTSTFIQGTTTFTLTATGTNGCMSCDYVTISVNELPQSNLGNTYSVCTNDSLHLNVSPNLICQWNGLITSTLNTIDEQINAPGTIVLTITDLNGCISTEEINIDVLPIPYPIISGSGLICQNSYWEKYSIPSTSNFLQWTVLNGEFQSDSTTNEVYVHWDSINPFNQVIGQIIIEETVASTGCHNSYVKNVVLDTAASPDPETVLALSSNVLYIAQDYPFISWGYESMSTHIPVSVGVYSQYCEFNNLDVSNYNYWVEIGDGNGCVTKSYFNAPIFTANIESDDSEKMAVYPNPTENFIMVKSNYSSSKYFIQDLKGSIVKNGIGTDYFSINLVDLPSGVYILNLNDGLRNHQTKIVKL